MKQLITAKMVTDFAATKKKEYCVQKGFLLTPSAKDVARHYGISFVECDSPNAAPSTPKAQADLAGADAQAIVEAVIEELDRRDHLKDILK